MNRGNAVEERMVETTRDGRVFIISMRRESKRNAVNRSLADELDCAFNEFEDDPDLWVGVLTGTTNVFSAGSDLAAAGDYETERGGQYGIIRRDRRKPLVAAVEGPALGGGMEIVLACDLVVASTSSRFGLPEVRRGVVPTCAALFRGPQTLPLNIAREMILTGESITADRAYAVGLVNLVTESGFALTGAIELARRIAANAPLSVQACLSALNEFVSHSDEQGWESTSRAAAAIEGTDDVQEGVSAFFEKRDPRWSGH
jgi:enoyl-CoA hydratase